MGSVILQPYLFFGGRCDEALAFYQSALEGEVEMLMRFNESPEPPPPEFLEPGFEDKVMHSQIRIGNQTLMMSDGCDSAQNFDGFRLALTYPSKEAATRAFDALAQGGTVDMPLMETFWSPLYGQVTDQFGVGWMVMVAIES